VSEENVPIDLLEGRDKTNWTLTFLIAIATVLLVLLVVLGVGYAKGDVKKLTDDEAFSIAAELDGMSFQVYKMGGTEIKAYERLMFISAEDKCVYVIQVNHERGIRKVTLFKYKVFKPIIFFNHLIIEPPVVESSWDNTEAKA